MSLLEHNSFSSPQESSPFVSVDLWKHEFRNCDSSVVINFTATLSQVPLDHRVSCTEFIALSPTESWQVFIIAKCAQKCSESPKATKHCVSSSDRKCGDMIT